MNKKTYKPSLGEPILPETLEKPESSGKKSLLEANLQSGSKNGPVVDRKVSSRMPTLPTVIDDNPKLKSEPVQVIVPDVNQQLDPHQSAISIPERSLFNMFVVFIQNGYDLCKNVYENSFCWQLCKSLMFFAVGLQVSKECCKYMSPTPETCFKKNDRAAWLERNETILNESCHVMSVCRIPSCPRADCSKNDVDDETKSSTPWHAPSCFTPPPSLYERLKLLRRKCVRGINSAYAIWRKVYYNDRFTWQLFKSLVLFTVGLKVFYDIYDYLYPQVCECNVRVTVVKIVADHILMKLGIST